LLSVFASRVMWVPVPVSWRFDMCTLWRVRVRPLGRLFFDSRRSGVRSFDFRFPVVFFFGGRDLGASLSRRCAGPSFPFLFFPLLII